MYAYKLSYRQIKVKHFIKDSVIKSGMSHRFARLSLSLTHILLDKVVVHLKTTVPYSELALTVMRLLLYLTSVMIKIGSYH